MTATPISSKDFAIVPILNDSLGTQLIPTNAIAHGSMTAIMERVNDSNSRNDSAALRREVSAARTRMDLVKRREAELKDREDALKAREDACSAREASVNRVKLQDSIKRLDGLSKRMGSLEVQEQEPIVYPPGYTNGHGDDTHRPGGELRVVAAKDPEQHNLQEEDDDT